MYHSSALDHPASSTSRQTARSNAGRSPSARGTTTPSSARAITANEVLPHPTAATGTLTSVASRTTSAGVKRLRRNVGPSATITTPTARRRARPRGRDGQTPAGSAHGDGGPLDDGVLGHEHPVDAPAPDTRIPVVRVRPPLLADQPGGTGHAVDDPRLRQGSPRPGARRAVPVRHHDGRQATLADDPAEELRLPQARPRGRDVEVRRDGEEHGAGRAVLEDRTDGVPRERGRPRTRPGSRRRAGERPGAPLDDPDPLLIEQQADGLAAPRARRGRRRRVPNATRDAT